MSTLRTRASKGSELTHGELDTNFKRNVQAKTATYSALVSDNRSLLECNHATVAFTVTLGDAATMAAAETGDYEVTIANIGAAVVTVARAGADTIDGAATSITLDTGDSVTLKVNSATDGYITNSVQLVGSSVQVVYSQDGASATGTTILPDDNTIPQITEGDQYLSKAITPVSAANLLKIEVVLHGAHSASGNAIQAALFQDATAGALAATRASRNQAINTTAVAVFTHYMTAGTVSETTFKVRAGGAASGTFTFNGVSGSRLLGGVMASSITITEYKA